MLCVVLKTLKMKIKNYDQTRFMALQCQTVYHEVLSSTKLLSERGICLDKVPEKLLAFHVRLVPLVRDVFPQIHAGQMNIGLGSSMKTSL